MDTRIEVDDAGRECLVRRGWGLVTSVAPVGIIDPAGLATSHRITITCEVVAGRAGSIRFAAYPIVGAGSPLLDVALAAHHDGLPVEWQARWSRHAWIAADLPVSALNLVTDASCTLLALTVRTEDGLIDIAIPDFVPAEWLEESS